MDDLGDYLIVDNAAVHCGSESYVVLEQILEIAQVKLIKLPCYSPELNPCELIFSKVKSYIRRYRGGACIQREVLDALGQVTWDNVRNYYKHCICPKVILPDFTIQ